MSFKSKLKDAVNSPASAYIQFVTKRNKGSYLAFSFVEDEDDISFYQHVLAEFRHIGYFGCGGKSGVFEVFEKLSAEGHAEGNLFMVDRDHEVAPFKPEAVLRTTVYSWEAHLCAPSVVCAFIQRKARPNLSKEEEEIVAARWEGTLAAYKPLLLAHAALLTLRHAPGQGLDLGSVRFGDQAEVAEGMLTPGAVELERIRAKKELSQLNREEKVWLSEYVNDNEVICPTRIAHGKALFSLLRSFIPHAVSGLARAIGGINSAKQVLSETPWSHTEFDYIREYATLRIANA